MKNIIFLFFPLFFLLSCKKQTELPTTVLPKEEPKDIIDMTNPFKGVIKANAERSFPYSMRENTDVTYLGALTNLENIKNKTANPYIGAQLIHTDFSFKDINNIIISKHTLEESNRSTFMEVYRDVVKNKNKVLTPKIDYQIYVSDNIDKETKTNIM